MGVLTEEKTFEELQAADPYQLHYMYNSIPITSLLLFCNL
jgi:hypothetical protein